MKRTARVALAGLIVVLAVMALASPTAFGQPPTPTTTKPLPDTPTDRATLEQLVLETNAAGSVQTNFTTFVNQQFSRLVTWLRERMQIPAFAWLTQVPMVMMWILLVLGPIGLLLLIYLIWRGLPRARRNPVVEETALQPEGVTVNWLELVESHMASGRAREALAAVWGFLATHLQEKQLVEYEPEQTNAEMVRQLRARHPNWPLLPELIALTRGLDRGMYGDEPPSIDTVKSMLQRSRELIA